MTTWWFQDNWHVYYQCTLVRLILCASRRDLVGILLTSFAAKTSDLSTTIGTEKHHIKMSTGSRWLQTNLPIWFDPKHFFPDFWYSKISLKVMFALFCMLLTLFDMLNILLSGFRFLWWYIMYSLFGFISLLASVGLHTTALPAPKWRVSPWSEHSKCSWICLCNPCGNMSWKPTVTGPMRQGGTGATKYLGEYRTILV